ncbi:hypothetical protein GXW82_32350 [Streptacidiphilus sp. 4-A2]|nr:hypothetical protein [Streptacidiphilus sp. 4-A2]
MLTPGGAALDFEVTVHNGSGTGYTDIQPLISMGHCSCGGGGAAMMPQGTLKLWNTASGSWQTIPYDAEGTGMDFSFVDQISGVALAAGADETFRYQVALSKPAHPVSNGSGTIDVTVQQLPAHTALIPTASTPSRSRSPGSHRTPVPLTRSHWVGGTARETPAGPAREGNGRAAPAAPQSVRDHGLRSVNCLS